MQLLTSYFEEALFSFRRKLKIFMCCKNIYLAGKLNLGTYLNRYVTMVGNSCKQLNTSNNFEKKLFD
jgi:hypothetical protein